MGNGYKVVIEALGAEAGRWDGFVDRVAAIDRQVDDLTLDLLAFTMGGPHSLGLELPAATKLCADYREFHRAYTKAVSGAATEFGEIGDALRRAAAVYQGAEDDAEVDLDIKEIF